MAAEAGGGGMPPLRWGRWGPFAGLPGGPEVIQPRAVALEGGFPGPGQALCNPECGIAPAAPFLTPAAPF